MRKAIAILVFNAFLFYLLRYLNLVVVYFLNDQQAHAMDGFWDFLPAYLLQTSALMVVYFGKIRREDTNGAYVYPLAVLLITLLYVGVYLKYIPDISLLIEL